MYKCRKVIYWIIAGIFISMAFSAMIVTRDGGIHQFFDNGYTEDLKETWKLNSYNFGQYNVKQDIFSWEEGGSVWSILIEGWEQETCYLRLDASYISGNGAKWEIHYIDVNGNVSAVDTFEFQNGESIIPIRVYEDGKICIYLVCSGNTEYKLKSMKLSEYEEPINSKQLVLIAIVCFAVYGMISYFVLRFMRKRDGIGDKGVSFLQDQADYIISFLNHPHCKKPYAKWVRTAIFIGIIIGWRLDNDYGASTYYGQAVLLHMILFVALISWIPVDKKKYDSNKAILKSWLWLCILQIISDIAVRKNYAFVGVWSLLCFGVLYRAWSRMERPEDLLEDFVCSAEILYLGNILFCVFSNNKELYGRLTGTWDNPNPFSNVVIFYLVAMFFRLYQVLVGKGKWYHLLEGGGGIAIGVWMLYRAECRTSWVGFAAILLVFIFKVAQYLVKKWNINKKWCIIGTVLILAGASISCIYLSSTILKSRSIASFSVDSISSGRITIWKRYIEQMNLWGHTWRADITLGSSSYAHNNFLKLMYKYGFIIGVVAIILVIEVLVAAIKFWKRNPYNEYSFLILGNVVAYLIPAFLEAINEYPMVVVNWFAFYLAVGFLKQERNVGLKDDG